jgi:hypothetical protein
MSAGEKSMDNRLAQHVRGLYFDIQTIEGVQPLEIWIGIREADDPFDMAALVKNLYKIVVPLVNEACFGTPFERHSLIARRAVKDLIDWFTKDPDTRLFSRFPYPPTGDGDQKELYRIVKNKASTIVTDLARTGSEVRTPPLDAPQAFPDGLFDFREMRIVDNELPYIIFTDKEFRVIHGLAIVYLWLIELDTIFVETLVEQGVEATLVEEYRQLARRVRKENPFTVHGRVMETTELLARLKTELQSQDYLDLFESVYAWFEQAKAKYLA